MVPSSGIGYLCAGHGQQLLEHVSSKDLQLYHHPILASNNYLICDSCQLCRLMKELPSQDYRVNVNNIIDKKIEPYELLQYLSICHLLNGSYDTHRIYVFSESATSRLVVDILSHAAPHIIRLIVRHGVTLSLE